METNETKKPRRFNVLIIGLVLLTVVVLTAGLTVWLAKIFLFPTAFQPVQLSQSEQQVLNRKIEAITSKPPPAQPRATEDSGSQGRGSGSIRRPITPEPYREIAANRKISLSERELNALLAKNTDLADKVALDLSKDMASVKVLIPLDPELPVLGGKTLKVTAGVELLIDKQGPKVILKGVSVWGVPMPNAWLGGMKNKDLLEIWGVHNGFRRGLSAGIDDIRVEDGRLTIQLAE